MESSLFLSDLRTGHEPALVPERELFQLAALRQATRLGRFSARASIRAAVWDKPRSDCTDGVSRFMGSSLFLSDLLTGHEPALVPERELFQLAALRQATPLGRFSARANIRAAVWDKPRSDCTGEGAGGGGFCPWRQGSFVFFYALIWFDMV
jgi:hypothetical protein